MDNPESSAEILEEAKHTRMLAARLLMQTASLLHQCRLSRRELRNTRKLISLNRGEIEQIRCYLRRAMTSSAALLDRQS